MGIEWKRNEDFFANSFKIDEINEVNDGLVRKIKNNKYISLSSNNIQALADKAKLLLNSKADLQGKMFVIDIVHGCYLTNEQCKQLEETKELLEKSGVTFKVKDGNFWELEEVSTVSKSLDEVVNKINSATVVENKERRSLNEMEKFLWAYSFVANRKYQKNVVDLDSPRKITSIITKGDCVCVGFATILKELCSKLNIECYINSCQVLDKKRNSIEGHCNNVVVLDGTAYYCDACWDCVSDNRRPRRTFSNCLISFEDRKDSTNTKIYDLTAPFVDMVGDLKDIKTKLNEIMQKQTLTEDEYKKFTTLQIDNRLSRYLEFIPKYKYNDKDFFLNRKFKEEAIYYYTEAIKLIESKQIKKLLEIEDFEKSLFNIYCAMGNSKEKALEKAQLDIQASIAEAGISYLPTATNCFVKEHNKNLEL